MDNFYFIFTNAPGQPYFIKAMFPIEKSKEAFEFYQNGGGYYDLRRGYWQGYGKMPEYNETKATK